LYKNAVTADAAAHALFIAGPHEWFDIARAMEISYAMLVDNENTLHITPELQQRLKILGKLPHTKLIHQE
jgi:thiamine biosynthesis lipoprotein